MLAKAVQKHGSSQAPKSTTQQPRIASVTLQPTSPTSLNAKNPLKRTASQAMGGHLSRDSWPLSGQEPTLARQESISSKHSSKEMSQTSIGGGRVGKLHDTVFFDENDFDDDVNIDLDSESMSSKTLVNSPDVSYPNLPVPVASTTPRPVPSSAPLPWSSSPLHHRHPTEKTSAPPLYPTLPDAEAPAPEPAPKASKRRTLPWHAEANSEPQSPPRQSPPSGPPAKIQALIEKSRKNKAAAKGSAGNTMLNSFTPLPKDKPNSPYPWNKTTSAVKKEQKALREHHKKLVKDDVKDPEAQRSGKPVTTKAKKVPRVFLSDEQRKVLDLVAESKKSVFFTGSAGTGKSVLLREIIRVLREKHKREPDRVAVTASTGLAACNVGGVTLHSFAGIGLGKEAAPELVKKIKRNSKAKIRWMRTKVLVIDEISMVDGDLFDKLESIARAIRNNGRPFGGIQLVITGDFFQLPPVPDYGRIAKFAFDAATWNTSIDHTIGLTQVFRQKDPGMPRLSRILSLLADIYAVFANMLNEMRLGRLSGKSIDTFKTLNRPLNFQDDFQATELWVTFVTSHKPR